MAQIVQNRIAHILGQWQPRLAAVLARDDECRLRPVKIAKPQRANVTRPQSEARYQQEDGAISRTQHRCRIAGLDQSLDVMGGKIFGQRGEPPPGHRWNRVIQANWAIPTSDQKAQKHSQCGGQVLRLLLARLLYLLKQEVPQSLGRKGTGVGSKILQ